MSKIIAIGDKIVIKPTDPEEMTSGGVILPDVAQEETMLGTVESVGPGRILDSGSPGWMQCKVGDTVMYPKFHFKKIEIDGEEYVIGREQELMVIISNFFDVLFFSTSNFMKVKFLFLKKRFFFIAFFEISIPVTQKLFLLKKILSLPLPHPISIKLFFIFPFLTLLRTNLAKLDSLILFFLM